MSRPPPVFSLVVPTYQESENIQEFVDGVSRALGEKPFEVIIVDDDSPDRTWARAQELAQSRPWLRVIRREGVRGLSSAVLDGFNSAQGKILGVMDADLSHDETLLPVLIAGIEKGSQMTVGSRRIPGGGATHWPFYRRMTSNWATFLAKHVLDVPLSDPMSGYFLIERSFYESCKERLTPTGYKILLEIAHKGRPERLQEIPFVFKDRKQGHSKMSALVIVQYLKMLGLLWGDRHAQALRHRYHTGRYKKVIRCLQNGDVLDIGCGRPCETMPDQSFLRALGRGTGVDIKPCEGPFPFFQADLAKLPFRDAQFDNVVAMEVLEHVTDHAQAFGEILRVLKPGGVVVMTVPRENWLWDKIWHLWQHSYGYLWNDTHIGTLKPAEWRHLLKRYFRVEVSSHHWYFDLLFVLRKQNPS